MSSELATAFESFASFGVSKSSNNLSNGVMMDNAHFAKMCKDSKIVGKNCTITDIDIIFKKVLPKGERKIDFIQFQQALKLIAEKKFAQDGHGIEKLVAQITASKPATTGTQANASGIYAKLTDSKLYTGSHKLRFDDEGKGRGLAGREPVSQTESLSQIVNRGSGTAAQSKKRSTSSSMEQLPRSAAGSKSNLNESSKKANVNNSKSNLNSTKAISGSGNVYDRLTNTKGFTGTHKHRFDETGKGRGIAGRDSAALGQGTHGKYHGGNVTSLSQILPQ
jgi:hypothetical protein